MRLAMEHLIKENGKKGHKCVPCSLQLNDHFTPALQFLQ